MSVKKHAVERKITSRVRMAVRWHRLRDEKGIAQFVLDDPKIKAINDDEELSQEVMPLVLMDLFGLVFGAYQAEDPERRLAELRQTYGDKLVQLVVEALNGQE
jgi:hypothetical protein